MVEKMKHKMCQKFSTYSGKQILRHNKTVIMSDFKWILVNS